MYTLGIGNTLCKGSSKRFFDILIYHKSSSALDKHIFVHVQVWRRRHASFVVKEWVAPRSVSRSFCASYTADIVPKVPSLPHLH